MGKERKAMDRENRMEKSGYLRRRTHGPLWLYLICGILICGLTGTIAWSGYRQSREGSGAAKIAQLVNGSEFTIDPDSLPRKPGESTQVKFKTANYEGEKVSEAMMGYTVTPETAGNLPLEFTLSRDESTTAANKNWIAPGNLTGNVPSTQGIFEAGEKAVHHYILTISWPVGGEDEAYAEEIDYVRIRIHAEQVSTAG